MKRPYSQIGLDERRKIERWRHAGVSVDVIAEKLGRYRSSIFHKSRRNTFRDKEIPELAGSVTVQMAGWRSNMMVLPYPIEHSTSHNR